MRKTVLLFALVTLFSVSAFAQTYTLNIGVTTNSKGTTDPTPGLHTYSAGDLVTLAAIPDAGHQFVQWFINGSPAGAANPYNFNITGNTTAVAMFTAWTVTITVDGGGVTTPGAGTHVYPNGTVLPVTAFPNPNYRLDHWEVNGIDVGRTNPMSMTLTADVAVHAVFKLARTLTLSAVGNGTTDPASPGTYEYSDGDTAVITPTATGAHEFVSWTIDGTPGASTDNPLSLLMDADHTVQAVFTDYIVTMAKTGNGSVDPAEGGHAYVSGAPVTVTATADPGNVFVQWQFSTGGTSTSNPYTFNVGSDVTVTGVFVPEYTLTVTNAGNGSTTPAAGSHGYPEGTNVNITASPVGGHVLCYWMVDGSQEGDWLEPGNLPDNPLAVTMDADHAVDAVFSSWFLTVAVDGSGTVSDGTGVTPVPDGYARMITATPNAGWRFDRWNRNGSFFSADATINVTVTADVTYTAVFIQQFDLTTSVSPAGAGTVDPSSGTFDADEDVLLTPTPALHYAFDHWEGDASGSDNPLTLTMDNNKSVIAVFVIITHELTTSVSPVGAGTVTPSGGTYNDGVSVDLTATPNPGYQFDHWEGDATGSANPVSVTMDDDKSVTAVFVQTFTLTTAVAPVGGGSVVPSGGVYPNGATPSVQAVPAAGYRFDHWEGDAAGSTSPITITMDADKSVTAVFVQQFALTTAVSPVGAGSVTPSGGMFDAGTSEDLTATANAGYRFDHWEGDATGSANPTSVTFDANRSVTAVFVPQYTLTTEVSPAGAGTVSPVGGIYDSGMNVDITATAYPGYRFDHWENGATGTANPVTVTMSANRLVRAVFVPRYDLTVNVSPVGAGTVDPSSGTYDGGTVVELTATPAATYVFDHWEGNATGNANPLSVTMNSNKNITAVFVKITYNLTVSVSPVGTGTVAAMPSGGVYEIGTVVELTATPAPTYRFDHWEGDATGTTNPVSVTMDGNRSVTAVFVVDTYALTTAVSPAGAGTVSPLSGEYPVDSVVNVTAIPAADYVFDHWEGDAAGTANPISVTMDSNKSITAVFTLITYTLTTNVFPAGWGTVTPASGSEYDIHSNVVVTATPAAGYQFDHWTGDLTGDTNPATVVMEANRSVTAYFMPACQVTTVDVLDPVDGATIIVDASTIGMGIPLTAAVDCVTDTAGVSFVIDDLDPVTATVPDGSGHFSAVSPPVSDLGYGLHTLVVQATSITTPSAFVFDTITFTVQWVIEDPDVDLNGLPDYPFAYLTNNGDTYVSTVDVAGTADDRMTSVKRWDGACDSEADLPQVVTIEDPADPSRVVSVTVPAGLLECGESGIVILQVSNSLAGLYGVAAAGGMTGEPDVLVENSLYAEVSIIVTDNMGGTYAEIDPARLAANPVRVAIEGLGFVEGGAPSLYSYPTIAADAGGSAGLQITPDEGSWTTDNVTELEVGESWLAADMVSLCTIAAYEGPALRTRPSDAYTYVFGFVELGSSKDVLFTVSNVGGGQISGAVTATAPFSIVGTNTYNLGAGESADVTVRFTPTATGAATGTVTFTGAGGATIQVVGTGYEFTAGCTGFGLSTTPGGTPKGDLLIVGIAMLALLVSSKLYAHRRQDS